jgi:hypothetical protein
MLQASERRLLIGGRGREEEMEQQRNGRIMIFRVQTCCSAGAVAWKD